MLPKGKNYDRRGQKELHVICQVPGTKTDFEMSNRDKKTKFAWTWYLPCLAKTVESILIDPLEIIHIQQIGPPVDEIEHAIKRENGQCPQSIGFMVLDHPRDVSTKCLCMH